MALNNKPRLLSVLYMAMYRIALEKPYSLKEGLCFLRCTNFWGNENCLLIESMRENKPENSPPFFWWQPNDKGYRQRKCWLLKMALKYQKIENEKAPL